MADKNSIFTEVYKVRSTQVNLNNRLGLYGLLGMLQDIASEHAERLGFGYSQLIKKGFFWALIQQHLKMKKWPKWNDEITIKTWSLPIRGIYAVREFEFFKEDEKIGDCTSTWITLDIERRRPIDLSSNPELFHPRKEGTLSYKSERIILPEKMFLHQKFEVKISDLDVNLHVNNVKYTQWVLDMIALDKHRDFVIREYEINFLSETFLGDEVEGFESGHRFIEKNKVEAFFYGKKAGEQKPAFISKYIAEKIN